MQSKYLSLGKNEKLFTFRVPVLDNIQSLVKLQLFYYPFEEKETLPIPYNCKISNETNEDKIPLTARKPGISVFWNERLIKEAHIPLLNGFRFTSIGKIDNEKLKDTWFYRVHGNLFINSDFPVTHNKMHICEQDLAFQSLKKYFDRKIEKEFRKWLLDCHKTLDHEIEFFEMKYNSNENKTYCKSFKKCKEIFKIGDYIVAQIKTNIHARIEKIYFDGQPEAKISEGCAVIIPSSYKTLPEINIKLSKIKYKIPEKEFEDYIREQKMKLPGLLQFYQGDGVNRPPERIKAGENIKWVTIALLDRQKPPQCVEKTILTEEKVKIMFKIIHKETNQLKYESETSIYYKNGKYSFSDLKCFQLSGTYLFYVSSNFENVKPIEHKLMVEPTEPETIKILLFNEKQQKDIYPINSDFPTLMVKQCDQYNNTVPFSKIPENIIFECKFENSKELIPISQPIFELYEKNIKINQIKLCSLKLKSKIEKAFFEFYYDKFSPAQFHFNIKAGTPTTLSFLNDIFDPPKNIFENKTYLPNFKVNLKDISGNIVTDNGYRLELSFQNIKKNTKTHFVEGTAEFNSDSIKIKSNYTEEILTFSVFDEKNNFLFEVPKKIVIKPSNIAQKIKILLENVEILEENDFNLKFKAIANQKLQPKLQILDESDKIISFKGKLDVSWSEKELIVDNPIEIIDLPELIIPKEIKFDSKTFMINLTNNKKISYKMNVEIMPGEMHSFFLETIGFSKIRCGQSIDIHIGVRDCYGNAIYEPNLEEQKKLSEIIPKIYVEPLEIIVKENTIEKSNKPPYIYICKLTLIGIGKVRIIAKDLTNTLQERDHTLEIQPGQISELRIKKKNEIFIECQKDDILEDILVVGCDSFGNIQKVNNIGLSITCKPCSPFKLPFQEKFKLLEGVCTLSNLEVIAKSGDYIIEIFSTTVQLKSCKVHLKIKLDPNKPNEIYLINKDQLKIIKAGEYFPSINIRILDGNKKPITTPQNDLSLFLDGITYNAIFEEDNLVFSFKNIEGPKKEGSYSLKFQYDNLETDFSLQVIPGKPYQLICDTEPSYNAQTTNGSILIKKIDLFVADKYKNIIFDISDIEIEVVIENDKSNNKNNKIVEIEGHLKNKIINGKATFENIKISNNKASSGIYWIVFFSTNNTLSPKKLQFVYTEKEEEVNYRSNLQKKLIELENNIREKELTKENMKKQLDKYKNENILIQEKIQNIKDEIQKISKYDKILEQINFQGTMNSKESIDDIIQKINKIKKEMLQKSRRKSYYGKNPVVEELLELLNLKGTEETGIIGIVADLGFIENDKEASLLAKIIGKKMQAVVFKDTNTFNFYYEKYKNSNCTTNFLALDLCSFFRTNNENNYKNQKELPIKMPLNISNPEGFLGFAVNRINLRKKHEELRKSLFYSLFGNLMIFDTLKNAQKYRKQIIDGHSSCPTIVCITNNEILESTGFVSVGNKNLDQSQLTFGQLPMNETYEFICFQRLEKLFEELKKYFEQCDLSQLSQNQKLEEKNLEILEKEIKTIKRNIHGIQKELEENIDEKKFNKKNRSK